VQGTTNDRNRALYQRLAAIYDLPAGLSMIARPRVQLFRLANLHPGQRVLVVGVGTGQDLVHLPAGTEVTGIDLSPAMLARARTRARALGSDATLLEMDAEDLAFPDESFDVVLLSYVLSVVGDPARALAEAARVLAPRGSIWIVGKFDERPPGPARKLASRILTAIGGARLTLSLTATIDDAPLRVVHRERASAAADIIQLTLDAVPPKVSRVPTSLPRSIDELEPEWFSRALSTRLGGSEVAEATVRDVVHGTATKAIVDLVYVDSCSEELPASVCVKGPFEPHTDMMAATGIYETEARFFRDIQPRIPVRAPAAFSADADPETKHGVVVLEDLTREGATFLRATVPVTSDDVANALEELALLHAAWWASSELDAHDLFITENNAAGAYAKSLDSDVVAARLAQPTRGTVVPRQLHDPDRIVQALWAWARTLPDGPHCLVHGDAHVGNAYRLPDGTVGFCDWQTLARGRWAHDVAYFVASALEPDERARAERDLLRHYLDRLAGHGADAPGFDDAWTDYRRHMVYGLFGWLTNLEQFQPEENITATIERFATAVVELDTYATLDLS
jgi:ubiquinone/menaquinone biosynthesis C-methylase UbiE